jgi:hypothetical protein
VTDACEDEIASSTMTASAGVTLATSCMSVSVNRHASGLGLGALGSSALSAANAA